MDQKRQITNNAENYPDLRRDYDFDLSDTDIFKKDSKLFFLHKKTTRLVSALHLLTDLMSDEEPLKLEIKKSALKVLSSVLSEKILFNEKAWTKEAEFSFLRLAGFVETAYLAGVISDMNFSIIFKEISNVIKTLSSYSSKFKDLDIGEDFFWTYKRHYKGQEEGKSTDYNKGQTKEVDTKRHTNNDSDYGMRKSSSISENRNLQKEEPRKAEKNSRQIEIIGIIKDKGTVSIKDISENIKDCSEKTIQRELLSMVSSGVLKKTGERRWSKYSLNL